MVLQLIEDADDRLLHCVSKKRPTFKLYNEQHVLHRLLPERHS